MTEGATEISEVSFSSIAPGDEIRLVQTTDAKVTQFQPVSDGRPGRLCFGVVRGGPFDGTEQWQWMPSNDVEAAAMKMKVYLRRPAPALGSTYVRPADDSVWSATSESGLYACISPGSQYKLGATEWRQNLGILEVTQ